MAGIVINTGESQCDRFSWLSESNMKFTVASAYKLLRKENDSGVWKGWKKICRLRVQERIKVFVWLLAHDKILTDWS